MMVKSLIGFNVGGWLTGVTTAGLTVTEKVVVTMLLLAPPSLTETEIVAEPEALLTGVKVSEPVEFGLV